jgi:hypothetical protein
MARKWKDSSRVERWGMIGGIIAAIAAVPFVIDLRIAGMNAFGIGVGAGAAYFVGLGLGRLVASFFPPE